MECHPERYPALELGDGGGTPPPPPPPTAVAGGSNGDGLDPFTRYCDEARALIPAGKVDWSASPFAWMRHHGPRTKSKLGRDIVRAWLADKGIAVSSEDDPVAHFIFGNAKAVVHLGLLGKEGKMEFANLREPGMGADVLMLVGIEPFRARLWKANPKETVALPHYTNDAEGYHNLSFDPEEPPAWLVEVERWAA